MSVFSEKMLALATALSKSTSMFAHTVKTKMYLMIPAARKLGYETCIFVTLMNYQGDLNTLLEWAVANKTLVAPSKVTPGQYLLVPSDGADAIAFWQLLGTNEFATRRMLLDVSLRVQNYESFMIDLPCSREYAEATAKKLDQFYLRFHQATDFGGTYEVHY